nr:MAG TPA: hypothetical protein [Bacteriophage sp.]
MSKPIEANLNKFYIFPILVPSNSGKASSFITF